MKSRRFRPDALGPNALESRELLSALGRAPTVSVSALTSGLLSGTQTGTYSARTIPDAGTTATLQGSARIAGLGKANFKSTIQGVGLIASGQATGTATITTKAGTLTLALVGPVQSGGGGGVLPKHYTVTVTGGTGLFAGIGGTGTADITLRAIGKAKAGGLSHGIAKIHYALTLGA